MLSLLRWWIAGCLIAAIVASASTLSAQHPSSGVILQNAASADGNGTAATVTGFPTIGVQATTSGGPPTFTLNFESSIDGSTFVATLCQPVGSQTLVTTATAAGQWRCQIAGSRFFRVRVSGYGGSGTITALGLMIADTARLLSAIQAGEWNIAHVTSIQHVAVVADFSGAGATNMVCHSRASFVTTASAIIAHGKTGLRLYICGIVLQGPGVGTVVSIVEGTAAACGTGTAPVIGSSIAGAGLALGYHIFSAVAPNPWIATATAGNQLCVLTSQAETRVVGVVTYGAW